MELLYDYTKPEHDWYHRPLAEGPSWLEPYFGTVAQSLLAEFGTPFYRIDQETHKQIPVGVVYANYSLDYLKHLMNSLELGKTGYGFIFSKEGKLLCHPDTSLVTKQKTVFEIAKLRKSEKLRSTLEKVTKDSRGITIDYYDKLTGQNAWIFFEPIPSTNWSLGAVFIKDDILVNTESQRQKIIIIILELIAFFFFLGILLFRAYQGRVKSLWLLSSYTSILLATVIVVIWYVALAKQIINESESDKDRVVLFGQAGLNKFLNSRTEDIDSWESPNYVPTGVFIQSLEFQDANDVFLTGYIWQKYEGGVHDGISRGFILPEAVDPKVTEHYRYQQDNWEVIGWYFEAQLRQEFDYSKYPFDQKEVWLRLWHKDFYKNVILVPYFDSYEVINPGYKPGLEQKFVLPGWIIEASFFAYQLNSYNTNFGINNYIGQENYPELYFLINIERDFINIFINNLMVPIVVALLLFLVHLLILKKSDALGIVSACSAFVFIVILDQINLRQEILAAGILYLEYFYFILYVLILAVAINAILFAQRTDIRWIQYQENLIPKLLYWPGMLTSLLVFTLFVFY